MISLREINRENYEQCLQLSVYPEQKNFVADNAYTLVQAAYEPNLYPLGIYLDEQMVGMLLYDYDEEIPGWSMSRLMIDKHYQNNGIGKQVIPIFLRYFYEEVGNVDIYTSAELENHAALHLYESMGFQPLSPFSYEHDGITFHEMRMVRKREMVK